MNNEGHEHIEPENKISSERRQENTVTRGQGNKVKWVALASPTWRFL